MKISKNGREGRLAALPAPGRTVRRGVLLAILGTMIVGAPSQAEEGASNSEPSYIQIRVTFPKRVTFHPLKGTVLSGSEQDGFVRTDYRGEADFYLPGPKSQNFLGRHVRHVDLKGTAAGPEEPFEIALSRSQRRTLTRTARREHLRFFRMRLRMFDVTEGRQPPDERKLTTRRRIFVK